MNLRLNDLHLVILQVRDFHVAKSEADIGFYAGILGKAKRSWCHDEKCPVYLNSLNNLGISYVHRPLAIGLLMDFRNNLPIYLLRPLDPMKRTKYLNLVLPNSKLLCERRSPGPTSMLMLCLF